MPAINQRSAPANTNNTTVYTVPGERRAMVNVNICALANCKVRIGVGTNAAPAAQDWLNYDVQLIAGGALERTGIVLPAGHRITVRTDIANAIAVQVYGIEELEV